MPQDIKSFFHEWCAKSKVEPAFECRPTGLTNFDRKRKKSIKKCFISGPKFRQRFLCEVRVAGFPYIGAGNSTNKKDAEKNASRDYVNFLVRSGKISENEVPTEGNDPNSSGSQPQGSSSSSNQQEQVSQNQGGGNFSNFHQPNQLGLAYQPSGYRPDQRDNSFGPQSYMERAQQAQRMEEAESLDVNASIHGQWTVENAKSKLNQFMQANKVKGEFRYQSIGPDHNR